MNGDDGPRMPTVQVVEYKDLDLQGGTLIVSVPNVGFGSTLLTDYVLEELRMDHAAAFLSEAFPPIAMMYAGKPRHPVRVHADADTNIAVLRCEFPPHPVLARPLARAILGWARERGFRRIIALDGLRAEDREDADGGPALWFATTDDEARALGLAQGLPEFEEGALGGVPAILLLESRYSEANVLTLLAEVTEPLDDLRDVVLFARYLPRFAPKLELDVGKLERSLAEVEEKVRGLREEAERTIERLQRSEKQHPSTAPDMYA